MKLFLFTIFLFHLCLFAVTKDPTVQKRFHFGFNVEAYDHFFAPMLRKPWWPYSPLEYICGGTWIHVKFALTTAYCLKYHENIEYVGRLSSENEWPSGEAHHDFTWKITGKFYFANYTNEDYYWFENDVGLVKANDMVYDPFGYFPKLFHNWGDLKTILSDPVVLFGFGKTESGNYAKHLKYMKGRLHILDEYSKKYCNIPAVLNQHAFCFEPTDPFTRVDNGDMGGPVYYDVHDPANLGSENRIIIGIVSYYYRAPRDIILTNVSYYQEWIDKIIKTRG